MNNEYGSPRQNVVPMSAGSSIGERHPLSLKILSSDFGTLLRIDYALYIFKKRGRDNGSIFLLFVILCLIHVFTVYRVRLILIRQKG
ncbi:hypothetical protein LEMLEM_LOCUS21671, partial [Lemmus lemmus]